MTTRRSLPILAIAHARVARVRPPNEEAETRSRKIFSAATCWAASANARHRWAIRPLYPRRKMESRGGRLPPMYHKRASALAACISLDHL